MDMPANRYIEKVKEFINLLNQNGIDVSEAYLFGSAVSGKIEENSDIDVAVVSPKFQGILFYDIEKISKFRRRIDLRLEIHPFSMSEIENDPPAFFQHIQQKGLRIH